MNVKDFLFPVALSVLTLWGINYYLGNKQETNNELRAGQSIVIDRNKVAQEPVLTNISLDSSEAIQAEVDTTVTTAYGNVVFSNRGGVLKQANFVQSISGQDRLLTPINAHELERSAFAIMLTENTPLWYNLTDKSEKDGNSVLTYQAENNQAIITKHITVFNKVPKFEVQLTVEPKSSEKGVQPRLFFPAPWIVEADKDYPVKGIIWDKKIEERPLSELANRVASIPSLFGAASRYFVNALVADANNFAQRVFYIGTAEGSTLTAILQGPVVKEATTWNMTFYCGPKDAHMMDAVDSRLSATLNYGIFSPIVKVLLTLLKFLYSYVHNYGWAILLLTLLIRLVMVPFTLKGDKAQQNQKEYQRRMQYVEQKYKHDPEALNRERVELTKKYGVSMLGCLPQLAQLPILLGLNKLLSSSVELYQAPFMGWITDLSARDPYYILPVLAGLGLFIQVSTVNKDAKRGVTMLLFAAFLIAVTANLSAGLTLYLCANTWLAIGQTALQKAWKR